MSVWEILKERWHRASGSAYWDLFIRLVWPVIVSASLTIWGWVGSLPGPVLVQLALASFAIVLFLHQNWPQKREKGQLIYTNQAPRWNEPTVEQVVDFISSLKRSGKDAGDRIPIKIVSTEEGQFTARMLAKAFQLADYEVVMNEKSTDYFFPARVTHGKIIVRYREKGSSDIRALQRDLAYLTLHSALRLLLEVDGGQPFPSSGDINYFQIEIGGSP